jgi:hypothetical protein
MRGEYVALTQTRAWLLLKAIDAESIADYYAGNWQTEEAEFWRAQAQTYRRLHSESEAVAGGA